MKDLSPITFRVRNGSKKEEVFEHTWAVHEPLITTTLDTEYSPATLEYIKDFLRTWFYFIIDNDHIEDPIKEGSWHEYFLVNRFPRFVLRASVNIGNL
jgi:hypothetical protein